MDRALNKVDRVKDNRSYELGASMLRTGSVLSDNGVMKATK